LRSQFLGPAKLAEDIAMLGDLSVKDRDFEFLFHAEQDGAIEDPDLHAQLGFVNLRFADWFSPFWDENPFNLA